jgi:hypothetical protein
MLTGSRHEKKGVIRRIGMKERSKRRVNSYSLVKKEKARPGGGEEIQRQRSDLKKEEERVEKARKGTSGAMPMKLDSKTHSDA